MSLLDGREPGDLEVYLRAGVVHARIAAAGGAAAGAPGGGLGGPGGPQRLTAPMPGKIVKVLVKPGDEVAVAAGPRRDRGDEDGERAAGDARRAT